MQKPLLNAGLKIHRLQNQRRIAYSLIERSRTLLKPGTAFTREIHELFRAQGKFGSKDRRLYRELIYTYLRYQPWLESSYANQDSFMDKLICLSAPTDEIQTLYPTLKDRAPLAIPSDQRFRSLGRDDDDLEQLLPDWFTSHTQRSPSPESLLNLVTRPPLWLRIQKDPREDLVDRLKAKANPAQAERIEKHPNVPDCIHAPSDFPLANHPCFLEGDVEIQDISSQILLHLLKEAPKGSWLDACAGAGGKTLQLANLLKPYGKVTAYDKRSSALRELHSRAKRSGLKNISVLDQRPTEGSYNGVLVDAPCSGSGTWRRHPYLMRQTREDEIFDYAKTQLAILKSYAPLVAEGGILVYSTCSLSRYENEAVQEKFLEDYTDFRHEPLSSRFGYEDRGRGITVYPEDHNGDGLYVATFRKKA
ncbi:RsmB/NOP family class I SAM-dependent RNA methyltransferase [Pelagicoccus sp. SDUM812002]|uniref:RsmB/NOP family class I SAM-dependent RNA methyltransferase n=1 Tax=Pelagicoccus sp. SDUM812002 TaxID=3041266 RepID=UPI00280F057B|nr:RsmB/NOP family class I SAM-dependent RNA methyltransferase [Pelagicoccus sp. SDUM812002]MDQ8187459.1 RsmB/NOP family class I SAM-dependent RNA methyltransferase [Pelagicoccus sp. SDUM812002]